MTTIAYRNGMMAGDSRITEGDSILPDVSRKVFKIRGGKYRGALFGASGDSEGTMLLLNSVRHGVQPPRLKNNNGLLVLPNATIYMFGGSVWEIVKAPSAAIGNGADFARAVLAYDPEAKIGRAHV